MKMLKYPNQDRVHTVCCL